jgi:hypothetical protein
MQERLTEYIGVRVTKKTAEYIELLRDMFTADGSDKWTKSAVVGAAIDGLIFEKRHALSIFVAKVARHQKKLCKREKV